MLPFCAEPIAATNVSSLFTKSLCIHWFVLRRHDAHAVEIVLVEKRFTSLRLSRSLSLSDKHLRMYGKRVRTRWIERDVMS